MYMNLLVIVIIGALGYLWVTRGFFSSLINLICVVMAGAIAFAFWEPTSLFLLGKLPRTGFASFLWQSSWALGLAIPFGVSLALLRAALDKALPNNIVLDPPADYVGGGICGVAAGAITAGMVVMSVGMLRLDTSLLGYKRLSNGTGGSLVSTGRLWVPVDDLVAGIYGRASTGVFSTSDALAHYYPNLADVPEMLRSSEGNGKAMNVMMPTSAQIVRRYRVGTDGMTVPQLLAPDTFAQTAQQVVDINEESFPAGSTLQGFVVQFAPPAREKSGQVVFGPGQVRLLVQRDEGGEIESKVLFPVAVVGQAAATPPRYGRFRFDAPNTFIASVGGASEFLFGFEFVVPNGFQPVGMYIRGVRYEIDVNSPTFRENGGTNFTAYPSISARDMAIPQGNLTGSLLPWTDEERRLVEENVQAEAVDDGSDPRGVMVRNSIVRYIIQKGTEQAIEIDENRRILQGRATFTEQSLEGRGLERNLRIDKFITDPSTAIVLVNVSVDSPNDVLVQGTSPTDRVQLVDSFGTRYDPVGYISKERDLVTISYFPGDPMDALSDLPTTSQSRPPPHYTLWLIYRVSAPTTLVSFEVGNVVVQRFEEPVEVLEQPLGR